jgi:hypothetical protein
MSPNEPIIPQTDRSHYAYDYGKKVSDYTIRELAGLFEHIEFWILDLKTGRFSPPFFIAIKLDNLKPDGNLDSKYGKLSLPEIAELLEQFTFHLSPDHPKYIGSGISYRIQGSLIDPDSSDPELKIAVGKLSLKQLGALIDRFVFAITNIDAGSEVTRLIDRFVFAITNIDAESEVTRRLRGDPEDGYENDPSLAKPNSDFSLQELLDALRNLEWNVTEGDREFHCTLHALTGKKSPGD